MENVWFGQTMFEAKFDAMVHEKVEQIIKRDARLNPMGLPMTPSKSEGIPHRPLRTYANCQGGNPVVKILKFRDIMFGSVAIVGGHLHQAVGCRRRHSPTNPGRRVKTPAHDARGCRIASIPYISMEGA